MIDVRTPAARASDPATSHEAAESITESGERSKQQDAVADAVRKHPGRTSHELSRATGLDRYAIARRLSEVETAGAIVRGTPRKCDVSGRKATTWWPVGLQQRLVA